MHHHPQPLSYPLSTQKETFQSILVNLIVLNSSPVHLLFFMFGLSSRLVYLVDWFIQQIGLSSRLVYSIQQIGLSSRLIYSVDWFIQQIGLSSRLVYPVDWFIQQIGLFSRLVHPVDGFIQQIVLSNKLVFYLSTYLSFLFFIYRNTDSKVSFQITNSRKSLK